MSSIISKSAVLVEMSISVWTAQLVDRRASDKVATDAHAAADAGKFRKNLMAGTTIRKDIADYAAICRTWHSNRTLPWSDKGTRLLPMSMFMDYKAEVGHRRALFESKVEKFMDQYPLLVQRAQVNLGDLFNADDYPPLDQIRDKFAFRLVFSPVPEAGDFRVDAPAAELELLRSEWEEAANARVDEAMATAWNKLYDMLTGMSEKLVDREDGTNKPFYATFVSNATDLCGLLQHLNIKNDPALTAACAELEKAIGGADIDDIRKDAEFRADIKRQVDATKAKVEAAISQFSTW